MEDPTMYPTTKPLYAYEFEEMLEALRRDLRIQSSLAKVSGEWAEWHASNARVDKRILEALNPKDKSAEAARSRMRELTATER
jgi:hypothetical protein